MPRSGCLQPRVILAICIGPLCLVGIGHAAVSPSPAAQDFDRNVAPILAKHCLGCHNSSDRKGELDLSRRAAVSKGGESGPPIAPSLPDQSLLWQRVAADEMPPESALNDDEKSTLKRWIQAGAGWGTDPIDVFRFTTETRAGRDWWSLQPLGHPSPPESPSVEHPIDAFVRARLRERKLRPSPPADARTLVRRLAFDITGLPPNPQDVAALEANNDAGTYNALARQLLGSPHYGEHWSRHWLDVARYGESDGFEYDRMRPNAWRYRDWVIEALNKDMPYLDFARLQIAGDVLHPTDSAAITATAFLVCGAHDSLIPQGEVMRQVMRQDTLEDFVGTVAQSFLGLTVNCARCHDHKFDPITQREYYQLTAALAGVNHGEREIQLDAARWQRIQAQVVEVRAAIESLEAPARNRILEERSEENIATATGPQPIAEWDFSLSLEDQIGQLHGTAAGGASIADDGLQLDGKSAFVASQPIPMDLKAKTLEAWVRLHNLEQRGGGVISVQNLDGGQFDAIVFGEREPLRWMAGSNGFARTQSFDAPEEQDAADQFIHVAITYGSDGKIAGYRQGRLYGQSYSSSAATFAAQKAQVVFGLRHSPADGNRLLAGTISRARLYDCELSAEQVAASANNQEFVSRAEILKQLQPDQQRLHRELTERLAELREEQGSIKDAKVYATIARPPTATHFLIRGNPLQKGDEVTPGGIAAITGIDAEFNLDVNATDAQRRKKLAEWVANADNPLFARVIVNRIWYYHFGRGLVVTPNDFGFNGGQPSHPDLLDWMARQLMERNWSLKELHYLIVTSETFRQSSRADETALQIDADNQWLWRFAPRRLSAEELRDAVLSVTGSLNRRQGGRPFQDVRPYMHRGAQFYEPIDPEGDEFCRRSVYRMWARGGRNPLLDAFDCPDPSVTAPLRAMTTTPIQALTMLNSSFVMRMSELFAKRLQRESAELDEQVRQAYRDAFARLPDSEEAELATRFVERHGLTAFCRVLLNSNEFMHLD